MKEEITVLMSVYNTPEEQLRNAIESILNQTYKNFIFMIIDDCSTDGSLEIIQSYSNKDDRIKIVKNEQNLGLENSLNKGVQLIETKYIARMDSDDIAYPERLEKQIKFAKQHEDYTIISGKADWFNENGVYGTSKMTGEICINDLLKGTPFIHPTMLIKTTDIKKIGGYPKYRRCEDYAMVLEMYYNGYKGYIMDEVLIKYRMDDVGYSKKKLNHRFMEVKLKSEYFKKLKIKWYKRIYIIKPIIAGLIPKKLMAKYQKNKLKNRSK